MSEWKKVSLSEMGIVSRGKSKHRPRNDARLYGGRYPFIQTGDIGAAGLYVTDYSQTYNEEGLAQSKLWEKNTLCITIAANIADTALLAFPACFPDSIMGFVPHKDVANVKYVKYCFDILKKDCQQISQGTAQDNLSWKKLSTIKFPCPPLEVQNRIATILSRYDSLIENYQKQIKLLEEAAQRLYKEWFVDLRFPGHENTKIVDGLPEGWEKMKLCEFTGITDGTHDSPKQVEIGLPLVTGRCIVDGSIDFSQAYNISEEDVIKINKRSAVEDGDILLSNIGTIGKVCRISKSGNYAVKNMIIFKPHDAIHSCFLHRFLTDNNTQMDFLQQAAGTSQKFVSLSFIRNTLILRPSDTILNLFYNHSEKYFNYVQTLQSQLRLLTEARDRLLPKLMSGEIEI